MFIDQKITLYSGANLVGYLLPVDGLKDANVSTELNGPSTLGFTLPVDSDKWSLLEDTALKARVDAREFVLLNPIEKEREGSLWGRVEMSEAQALLGRVYKTIGTVDLAVTILSGEAGQGGYGAGSAGSALYRLLAGSGWTVGTVDVTGTHDLETEKITLLENINEVQKIWGGWLVWDSINKTVSLRDDTLWATDAGFEIRHQKNQKTLKRTEKWEGVTTKLWPFGEKDLDIASVNSGVKYLTNYTYTTEVREGIYRREDIDDATELKTAATAYLATICRPQVQYSGSILDLRTLKGYDHETFSLGDIITIQDEELADAVKVRLISYSYDALQPWKCSLKLGDPINDPLKASSDAAFVADWIAKNLKPSTGVSQLRRGLVNTFTTIINSANGKVEWDDDTLTFIEIDGGGVETGKRMKLTPGGLGISTDYGASYVIAITGLGILADKIIVSDVYALSSDDTYTKMNSSGVHVYDAGAVERVLLGYWNDGTAHFGLRIKNVVGNTLVDDTGLLQTYQDHLVDNVDATHGLILNLYLPATTLVIVNALLRLKLAAFRAYETGAASGGGSTSGASSASTTPSGGGSTSGASSATTTASGGGATSGASSTSTTASGGGGTSGASSISTTMEGGAHKHVMFDPTGYSAIDRTKREYYYYDYSLYNKIANIEAADNIVMYTHGQDQAHTHTMEHTHTVPAHTHGMDHTHTVPAHTHDMPHTHTTPNHQHNIEHTHSTPNHTHGITYGIYEDTSATGVTVTINGTDRTAALGGPFNADQNGLDIKTYLVANQWNTILLGSTRLGRIDATVFLQAKMASST